MQCDKAETEGKYAIAAPSSPSNETEKRKLGSEVPCVANIEHPTSSSCKGFRSPRSLLDKPRLCRRLSQRKLNIAIDIASALDCMHSLKLHLSHSNVKATNVQINRARTVA
ncbi:Aste57867_1980 [Aphanomyces stellatus]|uniref:Aste57867_1980 protein n=1 Tax=Aphanomyces stellatus TaxID=120398 RepID=A0A485KA40_9STRA|nr:hypothetical protein As57867_001978 [Aphanomyces stellatus]VFT79185.1 Aste57867_1980 [Aphanomyces stellatus]